MRASAVLPAGSVHWMRIWALVPVLWIVSCGSDDDGDLSFGLTPCAERGGDRDEDRVCDADDNCVEVANSDQADADDDGRGDECDDTPGTCDDRGGDDDKDGACEHDDNCAGVPNPSQRDVDGDGLGDACDTVNGGDTCSGTGGDADGDSVCQAGDNCPSEANPDQRDADHDGAGDACDRTPEPCDGQGGDSDADTVCDEMDNCVETANVTQFDRDMDGIGDACDPSVAVTDGDPCAGIGGDDDQDSWCGMHDNCPEAANKSQEDTDGDELGDACDEEECDGLDNDGDEAVDEGMPDADEDGHADCKDPCPTIPDGDQDGDGVADCADLCPMDPSNDADKDNVCDGKDNCPLRANFNQSDRDYDGIGDQCDVEICDGLANDADTYIDEGMPDEDADRVCDEIDPCPGDRFNDLDGDGVCHASDDCPDTPNPDDGDADGDGIGDVCDLDAHCEASVPLLTPGAEPLPQLTRWADIAMSPDGSTLYALAGATALPYASEFLAVDIATRSVKWRLVLGGSPSMVELSSDGSRAWVILSGARSVRMVDIAGRRRCGDFATWSDTRQLLQPTRLWAIPGRSGSLLVTSDGTTRVYDEGQPRPKALPSSYNPPTLAVLDEHTVYSTGFNYSSALNVHTVGPEGFEAVTTYPGVIEDQIALLEGGRLYTTAGVIVDPEVPRRLADLPATGAVDVDQGRAEIYYAASNFSPNRGIVDIWSAQTFAYKGQIVRTSTPQAGNARRIFRWGAAGLVVLFSGSFSSDPDVLWIIDNIDTARTPQ